MKDGNYKFPRTNILSDNKKSRPCDENSLKMRLIQINKPELLKFLLTTPSDY